MMQAVLYWTGVVLLFALLFILGTGSEHGATPKKKKDISDYNDADLERLYEQWEEDDDPLEEDELPEWKRKPRSPQIDLSKIDTSNPEALLKLSKKGQTLMMFATVSGNPDKRDVEEITSLWQGSLYNAHIEAQRFVVDENRVIFMFKDGSQAWEAKDFLVQQDRCQEVTIEGKSYPGNVASNKHKKEL